jgi:hypothetical protein
MKKNNNIKNGNFGKIPVMQLLSVFLMVIPFSLSAQTTVFYDDFNRGSVVTPMSNGGTPTMTWTTSTTASPVGTSASNLSTTPNYGLQISANVASPAAGRTYMVGPLSTFDSPYTSVLNSNSGTVTWYMNMKVTRTTALSGFDAGNYGSAVILAMTSSDPTNTSTNGYAVILVKGSTNNAVKLVRFASGLILNSNVTSIIGPSSDLGAMTRWASVKVVYVPSSNTWSLFVRDDGSTTDPSDPTTGTLTQVGTNTVNSTYTSSTMTNFGFLWNHSNGAVSNQKALYDNFKVTVTIPAPTWTSGWPKSEAATQTGFTAKVNISAAGNAYYVVLPSGAIAPTSAQVKAGQDNTGTGVAANLKGTISVLAATTEYTAAVSGLTGNTTYDVYYVAEDASSNLQAAPVKASVTTTPPVAWTLGWPKAEIPTPTGFTAKVKTNVAGTSYYVVLASGASAPTSAQVKAGNDNTDSPALKNGSISCVAGGTEYTTAVIGLSGGTDYDVYFVAQDGSAILMGSPTKVTVTTSTSALAPSISSPTATSFTNNSALLGGDITSDGGSAITERGTVWKTSTGVTISDNLLAEGGTTTGIFSHSRTSLPPKSHIFYKGYATNIIGSTLTSEDSFYTLADEPTAQITGFTVTPASSVSVNLTWTAASGVDGYIIIQKQGSSAPTGTPTDKNTYTVGNTIGDGTVAAIITSGSTNSQSIGGLTASTAYSFAIYAVNSDGINAGTYNYYLSSAPTATGTTPAPPALSSSPTTLTGFGYIAGAGPSTSQSFNLSGTNLTGYPDDITVTGSTNYEVSTDNSSFSSSATVAFTSGTLSSTPVYVRLKAGLSVANYNSEVVASTGGGAASASNVTCSGTVVPAPTTYTWNQTGTASYATPTNWTPTRTTPATNDILVFNGGGSVVATGLTTQTIAQLQISNNTTVELQSSATATLTIAGSLGTDLDIQTGSALNLAQATNAITIAVGTGATGSIAGTISFTTAAHKLTSVDASGITFESSSTFTAGIGFTSNAFGAGTANSVVFTNGSKYICYSGANPFGLSAPSSVVVWQLGSTFVLKNIGAPSLGNRTYANFEMDETTGASFTSSSALTMDNLIITSGTWSLGIKALHTINGSISVANGATLNLNPTTAGTITLKGDINVVSGGTLNVNPTITEEITFSGTSAQAVNNAGTFSSTSGASYAVNNSTGVNIASNVTIPTLTINSGGILNVNAGKQLTVGTTMNNSGALNLLSTNVDGTATILTPATIGGSGGTYSAQQFLSSGRNWFISSPIAAATSAVVKDKASSKLWKYIEPNTGTILWDEITVSNQGLEVGRGYVAKLATDDVITFSGTLNNGNLTSPTLTSTGAVSTGFNLVGNPYPSYLNWTSATKSNVSTSIWYRSKSTGSYLFQTFNVSGAGIGTNGGTNIIPPMQSFWVKVTSGTGTVGFTNAMRSHQDQSVATNRLKAPTVSTQKILRLQVSNVVNADEAVIYFDANAQDGFDAYDSPKMTNANTAIPEIYTTVGNEQLVINGLKAVAPNKELALGFNTGSANSFTIKASEVSNFDNDTKIVLKDNLLNSEWDLTGGSAYSFSSDATNSTSRFTVIFRTTGAANGVENYYNDDTSLNIFKNVNNQITIQRSTIENATVTVCNAIGQKLNSTQMTGTSKVIDKPFSAGVYFVTVNKTTRKVIID